MKVYLMTDLEGVAGVVNFKDYVLWESRYYEKAKGLLTDEANAAIEGFFEAGASLVYVADGHGAGGLLPERLDARVQYIRGFPEPYPFGLQLEEFDVMAWVGQHAKAGTPYAHMPHTGSEYVLDVAVNGVSVGEFGQCALCGMELGVKPVFASGDEALCREARQLVPGIETVSVKRGLMPGSGDESLAEEYLHRANAAVHSTPAAAVRRIRVGARAALMRYALDPGSFTGVRMEPPYRQITRYRATQERTAYDEVKEHASSVIEMLNSRGQRI